MKGQLLGHIDCPSCGCKAGMRVTEDKNGHPFGYCEADCSQQLRVGGDERRVRKFLDLYPHLKAGTVTETVSAPAPAPAPVAVAPVPAPAPKPKREAVAGAFDVLLGLGREVKA